MNKVFPNSIILYDRLKWEETDRKFILYKKGNFVNKFTLNEQESAIR